MCGIAPVSRFEGALEGMHPHDFLPDCKSVISVAVRLMDGVIQSIFRNSEDGNLNAQSIYGSFGYTIAPNFQLLYVVYDIARYIERTTGEAATPTQAGPMNGGMAISQRHAAVAAGLGEFGWMGLVLTPQFGPRNRFSSILTTAELEPDPIYNGPRLCNAEKCRICTSVCPTGALSKYGEKEPRQVVYKDSDKVYQYCHINVNRCVIACGGLTTLTGDSDLVSSVDALPKEIQEAKNKTRREGELQHTPSWKCGRCLAYCPTGDWKKKFKDRGLSNRLPLRKS